MAATRARGRTVIENAAREPEIQDLARMLVRYRCARISGSRLACDRDRRRRSPARRGASRDSRPNRSRLADGRGGDHRRRCAGAGAPIDHLDAVIAKLREAGASLPPVPTLAAAASASRGTAARSCRRASHAAVSGVSDRFAGADDGAPDAGRRHLSDRRDHLRKSIHARARAAQDGRRHRDEGTDRGSARTRAAERSARDGD